ncbi:hypothetical protein ACFZCT_22080 [Streptomyces qaidamensis]|uniref:hypothetical protein n=1 Tax=Streptomyces qaidamensis TaxID=1783515 RepID=UPI0036EDCD12
MPMGLMVASPGTDSWTEFIGCQAVPPTRDGSHPPRSPSSPAPDPPGLVPLVYEDDPKTDAGARTIALDSDTVEVLRRHRAQQDADREKWETAWVETGRVFTRENGELLHPANVTRRFIELYEEIGLPPVRLHDLRHGAATLAHAAGPT